MHHGLMYQGGYESNFSDLKAGSNSFKGSDGTTRQLPDWPEQVDGVRFGYMEKPGKHFVAVRVQFEEKDVVLENPIAVDAARHMGYGKRFGPEPTVIPDETARVLMTDIMKKNLDQVQDLQPIFDQIPLSARRQFE